MSRSMHSHELFYRSTKDGVASLTRFAANSKSSKEPDNHFIELAEGAAKSITLLSDALGQHRDGVVYRVDGQCEFFVSHHFYQYPNRT